jgi:gluconokinase
VIVLVMGVSGVGKTTVGSALAQTLEWAFLDADDYHPQANVAKMASGIALSDADRWPWLDAMNARLRGLEDQGRSAILACSALKAAYRTRLTRGLSTVRTVFLHGPFDLIKERAIGREHAFMPPGLVQSQFEALEPPEGALALDVNASVSACVASIRAGLKI